MAITIRNCDQEPIHALGLTQGHGALIAFDQAGMTIAASGNAALLLGPVPMLGTRMDNQHFDQAARSAIARALADQGLTLESVACQSADGAAFDLVMHWSAGLLLVEWEARS